MTLSSSSYRVFSNTGDRSESYGLKGPRYFNNLIKKSGLKDRNKLETKNSNYFWVTTYLVALLGITLTRIKLHRQQLSRCWLKLITPPRDFTCSLSIWQVHAMITQVLLYRKWIKLFFSWNGIQTSTAEKFWNKNENFPARAQNSKDPRAEGSRATKKEARNGNTHS